MNRCYPIVLLVVVVSFTSLHIAYAYGPTIPWKVTIMKNGSVANNTTFWPPEIQAREGDTITWINNDTTAHTITSGLPNQLNYSGKIFDSGILNPGQRYSFTIPTGIWSAYYYYCKIHPWMTGKIDVGVAYLGESPVFTVKTDKESYFNNETIQISGVVNDTSQIMPLTLQIFDSQRNLVFLGSISLLSDHSFVYNLKASDSIFKHTGTYKIKAFYGFPATVTDANLFFDNQSNTSSNVDYNIPSWIKNNAKWWSDNQISDQDFIKGVKFLVKAGDLKTHDSGQALTKTDSIPSWVRSDAGWWANGTISDEEFIPDMQYLIDHNMINA